MNKSTQRRVLSGRINLYLLRCLHLATSSFVAVSGFGYELGSFLQDRIWVGPQDGQFFCKAQLAVHCAAAVPFGFANDGTFHDRNVTLIFES